MHNQTVMSFCFLKYSFIVFFFLSIYPADEDNLDDLLPSNDEKRFLDDVTRWAY